MEANKESRESKEGYESSEVLKVKKIKRVDLRQLSFLFQLSIQKHLMAILLPVLPTRHMYPVVEAILRFEDQLVIVGMFFKEVEPSVGYLHIGMLLAILPLGVWGLGQADVGRLAQGVLAGIHTPDLDVEGPTAVSRADDDGHSCKLPQRLQDGAA